MLLLDTHVVLWLALEPGRISKRAEDAMSSARSKEGGLAIAACTFWEVALLQSKGKIQLDSSVESFLRRIEERYSVLTLTPQIAARGVLFETPYPKDPADRQIGATALVHQLELVTADKAILHSEQVSCIW